MANISILPGRLREKNGYYHLVIDAKNPLNNTQIRHSKSTGLKVTEKQKQHQRRTIIRHSVCCKNLEKNGLIFILKE